MQRHPAVQESLAFGKPDNKVQEIITMVVVLNSGYEVQCSSSSMLEFIIRINVGIDNHSLVTSRSPRNWRRSWWST